MRVVSDTSPLSNLAIIGRLELLREQFVEVLIPESVATELKSFGHRRGRELLEAAQTDGWIRIVAVTDPAMAALISAQLDRGEAEAIALATELRADWLLIDEREGRMIARLAGLRMTGVLGVLLRAKLEGRIPALKPEIEALRSDARFFISKDLESEVLAHAGE